CARDRDRNFDYW
nr:immunoglobulin heavy chain junction region [Mus musculus]